MYNRKSKTKWNATSLHSILIGDSQMSNDQNEVDIVKALLPEKKSATPQLACPNCKYKSVEPEVSPRTNEERWVCQRRCGFIVPKNKEMTDSLLQYTIKAFIKGQKK